jgi:hypothetical protein
MTGELTALIAVCDVITSWQRYEQLRRQGLPPLAAASEVQQLASTAYCTVQEFGVRRDGVAIPLRRRIEWGSRSNSPDPGAQWRYVTLESMRQQVLNVVIPDDAEQTGDTHPWNEFVETLKVAEIHTSVDELRKLPYNVVFAPRLYDVLVGAADAEDVAFNDLTSLQTRKP